MQIDFIGDIHGHYDELTQLLEKLGYRRQNQRWTHSTSSLLFLGDLIDRGPKQRETVELVKGLCEQGLAVCLTGNHEFNAVGFVTPRVDDPSQFVRSHTRNHISQHEQFLNAFANDRAAYDETLDWFASLPLWFQTDHVRAVHACWNEKAQETLQPLLTHNNAPISREFYGETGIINSPAWISREILLNGMEAKLPYGAYFNDYYGIRRHHIRVNWWEANQSTFRAAAVIDESQRDKIPDLKMVDESPEYEGMLCFFGHYWMRGKPKINHRRAVCLDYSVALNDGALCAYRFTGETDAIDSKLMWVDRL